MKEKDNIDRKMYSTFSKNRTRLDFLKDQLQDTSWMDLILAHSTINKNCSNNWKKSVDILPIVEKIYPYLNNGIKVVGYISSMHFYLKQQIYKMHRLETFLSGHESSLPIHYLNDLHTQLTSLNVTNFYSNELDIDFLKELITADIQFNREGRVIAIVYQTHSENRSGDRNHQFFAYHPNDKNNPDLKNIWVDVYR